MADKKTDDLVRRPLYVFDLPPEILVSLTPKDVADSQTDNTPESPKVSSKDKSEGGSSENLVGSQACSLCRQEFPTVQDQRSHLKSDLHHYNLKQKLRGQKAVTEVEFEKLIGGATSRNRCPDSVRRVADMNRPG